MTEIKILLDEQIVNRAKRAANRRHANLNSLVRQYVEQIAAEDEESRSSVVLEIERTFRELGSPMGGVDWTSREALHER